jgi:hypothetical protein
MNRINDGGPAFPLPVNDEQCRARFDSGYGGMTLRDYFAAHAMAALIAEPLNEGERSAASAWTARMQMRGPDLIATAAYIMADAMLKAREVSND